MVVVVVVVCAFFWWPRILIDTSLLSIQGSSADYRIIQLLFYYCNCILWFQGITLWLMAKKWCYYDRCCHSWSFGWIKFGCSHQDRVTIKSMLNSWKIHSLQVKNLLLTVEALLALIMHNESVKSCLQADLFDLNMRKRMWLKKYFFINNIDLQI